MKQKNKKLQTKEENLIKFFQQIQLFINNQNQNYEEITLNLKEILNKEGQAVVEKQKIIG